MTRLCGKQIEGWLTHARQGAPVYLVGIGGCGMSGLAHLLLDLGFTVYGSDLQVNHEVIQLRTRGVQIFEGHAPNQIHSVQPEMLVYSSAIRMDNPEMHKAEKMNIPVVRRAVMLAALLKRCRGVCVAGMHGKTTTTALLTQALDALGSSPGYAIGATVPQLGHNARMVDKEGNFFVVEADESDGSLREFHSEQAIVLNIDEEHLDYYANFDAVCEEFIRFAKQTSGTIFYCLDDPRLAELYGGCDDMISYGFNPTADYRVEMQRDKGFLVWNHGHCLGKFHINLFGEKNVSNAVAVVAFLHQNRFQPDEIAKSLLTCLGANRRQQEIYQDGNYRIFDDYGHHPCEIRATLRAIKQQYNCRLVVAFQPHRYSRTQHLLNEFSSCFEDADLLWVTEVYAASETPIADINGKRLATSIAKSGQSAAFASTLDILCQKVRMAMRPGDVVIFMGAGDITNVAHQVADKLKMKSASHAEMFRETLSANSCILEDELLSSRTTLKVGGPADILIEPADESDLSLALTYCASKKIQVFMLGRGSNLVIRDEGIRGVVINLKNAALSRIEVKGEELHCGAGARLKHIANAARDAGLGGLEFLEGIPGSLGGALRMNAGAWGTETFDIVKEIRYMTRSGTIEKRQSSDMEAVYRSCPLLKESIALTAVLLGKPTDPEVVRSNMEVFRKKRTSHQPKARSAGCMFKNPEDNSAGKLVDECGLKEMCVGGASISREHGNFIVNDGSATADDVIELINRVRERVRKEKGVELDLEVQIVGK